MRAVPEPRNYAEQVFHDAGREATARIQPSAPERQVEALESIFMTEEERIDADRAAFNERLDAKVTEGKLRPHEAYYERQRFETEGVSQPTPTAERADTQNRSGQAREQTADDGLMSSYVSDDTKAEQKAAQAAREQQRGGRNGGFER